MPRKKREVEASLCRKGFQQDVRHHQFFVYFTREGKKTPVRTKTSHSPKMKDIPDNLLSQMAKQCKLAKSEFLDLVDCPLERDKYEEALSRQGAL
jgi:hypothetical protein